jgi:hypothetical protein
LDRELLKAAFNHLISEGSGGFTLKLNGEVYDEPRGYAVASKTCKNPDEVINNVLPHQYIGYWKNPETGKEFFEVVDVIEDGLTAVLIGMQRRQEAIYDFAKDEVIDLREMYQSDGR